MSAPLIRSRYFRDGQRVKAAVDIRYTLAIPGEGIAPLVVKEGARGVVIRRQPDRTGYVVKWDDVDGWELATPCAELAAAPTLVLLFSNVSRADLAARLHAPQCPMVHTARGMRAAVSRTDDPTDEDIIDLNERGFQVQRCKCLKAAHGADGQRYTVDPTDPRKLLP